MKRPHFPGRLLPGSPRPAASRWRVHLALAFAVVGLAITQIGVAGTALSCAPHPDASPESVASGTDVLATGERFFDQFDVAVLGTVVSVVTDEDETSHRYGRTEVTVDVRGALGDWNLPPRLVLTTPDPGWSAGVDYSVGKSYFIPVVYDGPQGYENLSTACDPVSQIGDVDATAAELVESALATGLPATYIAPIEAENGDGDPSGVSLGTPLSEAPWTDPAASTASPILVGLAVLGLVLLGAAVPILWSAHVQRPEKPSRHPLHR